MIYAALVLTHLLCAAIGHWIGSRRKQATIDELQAGWAEFRDEARELLGPDNDK